MNYSFLSKVTPDLSANHKNLSKQISQLRGALHCECKSPSQLKVGVTMNMIGSYSSIDLRVTPFCV